MTHGILGDCPLHRVGPDCGARIVFLRGSVRRPFPRILTTTAALERRAPGAFHDGVNIGRHRRRSVGASVRWPDLLSAAFGAHLIRGTGIGVGYPDGATESITLVARSCGRGVVRRCVRHLLSIRRCRIAVRH